MAMSCSVDDDSISAGGISPAAIQRRHKDNCAQRGQPEEDVRNVSVLGYPIGRNTHLRKKHMSPIHQMTLFRNITLLGLVACASSACNSGNPACTEEVRQRLLSDCAVTLGSSAISLCAPFEDADPVTRASETELSVDLAVCEARNPSFDADCLLEASCEDLVLRGACVTSEIRYSEQCSKGCKDMNDECVAACLANGSGSDCADCVRLCDFNDAECLNSCRE